MKGETMENTAVCTIYVPKILTARQLNRIEQALKEGERIELTLEKDGNVKMRTVWRKELKI